MDSLWDLFQRDRRDLRDCDALGIQLDFSRMDISPRLVDQMFNSLEQTGAFYRAFSLMAFLALLASMFSVSGSISTITGTRPCWTSGQMVVDHDRAETMTSSPGMSRPYRGFVRAEIASRFADEPELTIMA